MARLICGGTRARSLIAEPHANIQFTVLARLDCFVASLSQ
jgi:hypothetical protein